MKRTEPPRAPVVPSGNDGKPRWISDGYQIYVVIYRLSGDCAVPVTLCPPLGSSELGQAEGPGHPLPLVAPTCETAALLHTPLKAARRSRALSMGSDDDSDDDDDRKTEFDGPCSCV